MKPILPPCLACAAFLLGGCGHPPTASQAVFTSRSAVETREREERTFATSDRERILRAVVVTLQELGFVIDQADAGLGLVTATKLDTYTLRATVTVRPRGTGQMVVRLNAQYALPRQTGGARSLTEPAAFQDFFAALSKSMFVAAQAVP